MSPRTHEAPRRLGIAFGLTVLPVGLVLVSACNLVFGLDPLTYDPAQRIIAFVDAAEAEVPQDGASDVALDGAGDAGDGGDANDANDSNSNDASSSDAGDANSD